MSEDVTGTLRFSEFEGGFWSIEPDGDGQALVASGWTPPTGLADGSRVRVRVRAREEQFGFLMAGTYVDVLEIAPA